MRKSKSKISGCVVTVMLACVVFLSACGGNTNQPETPESQVYTIQYADNTGIHSFEVQSGNLYSISVIPEKTGYDFLGLYDAEVGGTQYIKANGISVATFTDKKNIVLYPQFRAKEYTIILDYQGAAITGSRSIKVTYDSEISELPWNLSLDNKVFMGWYTEPNRQGVQIADQYGVLPESKKITEQTYDITDPNGNIRLYAGFKSEEYTITFYGSENNTPEEVKVEYGTPISDVQIDTLVNGKAVLSWSKKRNDINKEQIFDGKVTSDMVLYAAEFAPIISFDSNGGEKVSSIIAREGSAIDLPIPIKTDYVFVNWQTVNGTVFDLSIMPSDSLTLTAKWQAIIMFDTNGGTAVENISQPQGTEITLPETEREGYIFAGWYDAENEKYTNTIMPSSSVKLTGRYWKQSKMTKVLIGADNVFTVRNTNLKPNMNTAYKVLDLSDISDMGIQDIVISVNYKVRVPHATDGPSTRYPVKTIMSWYSTNAVADESKVWEFQDTHADSNGVITKEQTQLDLPVDGKFYICFYSNNSRGGDREWSNFYVNIEYLDIITLY